MAAAKDVLLMLERLPVRQPGGASVSAYQEERLTCVAVEQTRRKGPWPQKMVTAFATTVFRTYVAISQPVRSPVSNRKGIDRRCRIVVPTATSGL